MHELQQALNALGASPLLVPDGQFGPKTATQVRTFLGGSGSYCNSQRTKLQDLLDSYVAVPDVYRQDEDAARDALVASSFKPTSSAHCSERLGPGQVGKVTYMRQDGEELVVVDGRQAGERPTTLAPNGQALTILVSTGACFTIVPTIDSEPPVAT